jgi:hypothetical protein
MSKNLIYGLVAVVVLALGGSTYYFMGSKEKCCQKQASCGTMTDSTAIVSDSTAQDSTAADTLK